MGCLDDAEDWINPFSGQERLDMLTGASAAKEANAANEKRYQQALGLWDSAQALQNQNLQRGLFFQERAVPEVKYGYGQALAQASQFGRDARQEALDREQQTLGDVRQGLAQRGLYNSAIGAQAQRGIQRDTNRTLTGIGESVAGLKAGLHAQQGQAVSQAYQDLARFYGLKANLDTALYGGKIGTISERQDVAAPGLPIAEIAQLAAAFL